MSKRVTRQKSASPLRRVLMGILAAGTIMLAGLAWAAAGPVDGPATLGSSPTPEKRLQVQEAYGRLPLYFIENRGQVDKRVKFYSQNGGQTTWFTKEGVVVSLSRQLEKPAQTGMKQRPGPPARSKRPEIRTTAVGLSPVGLRKGVKVTALEPQEHRVNYFIGNNPKKWRTDVPTYQAVAYREAYKGIDLKFYGDGRQLEYDIIVKPGADPNLVKFQYAGIKGLEVTPAGDLAIQLPDGGVLVQKKPVVYQEIAGTRVAREGKFKLHGDVAGHTYGFEVAAYDKAQPLIIDPVLVYSTYLGGTNHDYGVSIAVDSAGCAYVAGITSSTDFVPPAPSGVTSYQRVKQGGQECYFLTKFNATGKALIYSNYLGGTTTDILIYEQYLPRVGLAVDAAGCAYIAGVTKSSNFPTTPPNVPYPSLSASKISTHYDEAIVTKFNAAGNGLVYSTFMNGIEPNEANAIAVDANGNAFVTGKCQSYLSFNGIPNFLGNAGEVGFLTKVNPSGSSFLFNKALGTSLSTTAWGVAVDQAGCPYVVGETQDLGFPTVNPIQASIGGEIGVFITKHAAANGATLFSTYLGGSTDKDGWPAYNQGHGIAVDQYGDIYVTGETTATNFPQAGGAVQENFGGPGTDAFVAKIHPVSPTKLVYSSYLGGDSHDTGFAIAVNRKGEAYVTGSTDSTNFPLKNPLRILWNGTNAFVTKISFNGVKMSLVYSTLLGGGAGALTGDNARGLGIAVDKKGYAYVAGETSSQTFPTSLNTYQPTKKYGSDAFVTKLSDGAARGGMLELLLLQ